MSIKFSCQACAKSYSLPDAQAGKKARCTCGKVMVIPQPEAPEQDALYDLMPDEPVERLPAAAQRVFEQPTAHRSGYEAPSAAPRAAPAMASTPAPAAPWGARTSRAPGDGVSAWKKIGGAICTLLVLLGAAGRIYRIYSRVTDDPASSGSSSLASTADLPTPKAITHVTPPPRASLTSRGQYVSAQLSVQNCAGSTTNMEVMLPPGQHARGALPCVFVAPAGSTLLTGNALESDYTDESLPYVKSGFAVVRYSLAGHLSVDIDKASDAQILSAYGQFRAAHGGVSDASAAIDTVIADYPEIDPNRLYVAGHSSAATAAMLVAQKDTRIRACVAYAPAIDLRERFRENWSDLSQFPGWSDFIPDTNPAEQGAPRVPVLLFHARDDSNVPVTGSERYAQQHGSKVKLITVPTGDHYDSMIRAGIPAGINFLSTDMHAKG